MRANDAHTAILKIVKVKGDVDISMIPIPFLDSSTIIRIFLLVSAVRCLSSRSFEYWILDILVRMAQPLLLETFSFDIISLLLNSQCFKSVYGLDNNIY